MRTTVTISDELLVNAKRRAKMQGLTLGQVIDAALRRELADPGPPTERPEIPVFTDGSGPRAGLDLASGRALHEALDEGRELIELR